MALSNTAPGLIRPMGQQMEFGKVLKSSVRIVAPNVVSMRIATGMGKKIKKVPERMTKEIKIPIENLWLGPVDTEVGLSKPDSINVVITNVDQILPDLWRKYQMMKQEAEAANRRMKEWKQKFEKSELKIIEQEKRIDDLLSKVD